VKAFKDYSKVQNILNTFQFKYMIVEILLAIFQPNIFCKSILKINIDLYVETDEAIYLVKAKYCINDFLLVVCYIRSYTFYRFLICSSSFYDQKAYRVTYLYY
jgi:hypothetical protein